MFGYKKAKIAESSSHKILRSVLPPELTTSTPFSERFAKVLFFVVAGVAFWFGAFVETNTRFFETTWCSFYNTCSTFLNSNF
jgi:hypothetical protein